MLLINQKLFHSIFLTLVIIFIFQVPSYSQTTQDPVQINVDLNNTIAPMDPVWAWIGHDEPNYTYMKDGKKLLTELSDLSPGPVYMRVHNLLSTGDGTPALKWGSTNAYTEDEDGNPIYNWTIIDKIFDTYIERGMKPLVEIGFMPEALSTNPQPYQHTWSPKAEYNEIYTGWAYPPNDYEKWAELVYQWVNHSVERYGKDEVETWYWELWNEPNIGYWQGTTEEYIKLYDYTADAVKRALPTAVMGGPHVTGPNWDVSETFLRTFLDHCSRGKNHVTGETGSPLEFIAFHAKGAPSLIDGVVRMDMGRQLGDISKGFEIVASYPEWKHLPIIIGESDPEGCAACSVNDHPQNAYRNGTLYSSYTAASFARKYQLADHFGINFMGAVTWAFEFEDQEWFAGYRDLATNGVDKPVLNVFRMFGMMSGERVVVSGNLAYGFEDIRAESVRGEQNDINALASINERSAAVMVWNYHDLNVLGDVNEIEVNLRGIPATKVLLHHYRIDQEHSNSYEVWKGMGSPQHPTAEQYKELEQAGQLELLTSPEYINIDDSNVVISFSLPRQGVSLLRFTW